MKAYFIAPEDRSKWYNNNQVWSSCYQSWVDSSFDTVLLNDKEDIDSIIKENNDGNFFDILQQLPSIYKIDYVRYIILRNTGGVYADMDVYLQNDFKHLIKPNKIYINGRGQGLCNSLMISPKHDFWDSVMKECRVRVKNVFHDIKNDKEYIQGRYTNFKVDRQSFLTGAILLQDVITQRNLWKKVQVLNEYFFNREARGNDFAYCIHYQTSMWRLPKGHRERKTKKSFKE
jgi:mannosyltransferase OCH1-like enzyme